MIERIERIDLERVLAGRSKTRTFAAVLNHIRNPEDLLRLLASYIQFNSAFGGGVANLAGEIAVRQDLFRNPDEPISLMADRSVEVASDVLYAATDEFDDRSTSHRDSHRSLAQATFKAAGSFFGYDPRSLDRVAQVNQATQDTMRQVRDGYCVNQTVDERELFEAIGFHMGSEVLADEEFNTLDRFLRSGYPELVAFLEHEEVEIDGIRHASYYWIHIHTTVESDHFGAAVAAADRSLRYYAGGEAKATAKGWILSGFEHFTDVQSSFLESIREMLEPQE